MRDRQARGKDPYAASEFSSGANDKMELELDLGNPAASSSSSSSSSSSPPRSSKKPPLVFGWGPSHPADPQDFAGSERRNKAACYLDSPEMLMMYAQATGDSIQAVRLHFMKMLCGYDDKSVRAGASGNFGAQRGPHATTPVRNADKRRGGDRAATGR
ncbi:hypothetical protein P8C59_006347 [Phyllachora maydis]|uniref:Uncharacterized protein n=1 Tax=Phyllachora maydis TaxID=1825666 RepID=A0AAD9I6K2_9PEZI|nr:hypothetical protein P8C59_006347 [Phyllachora maydis]